jgi:hypothetical protein
MKNQLLLVGFLFCLSIPLLQAQNVGIGTTAPDEKLHLIGHLKMEDGTEGFGKIMMSDTNGVASWIDPNTGLPLPDTAYPIPIKYHLKYLMVYPVDNAINIDWQMAVDTCQSLNAFGYEDWYLPSLPELNAMYKQSYLITGLSESVDAKYWSSTTSGSTDAFSQRLDYGGPDPDVKTDTLSHHCRCIRHD